MPFSIARVRLGFYMGYAPPGTNPTELIALAQEAERLGYDSAWAAEAWGTDAVTVLSWLAATTTTIKVGSAIIQIPGRTPANTAMTAATLDLLSGGRFLLGLGTSGPQVVEGWHGSRGASRSPRRASTSRSCGGSAARGVEHEGEHYDVPYSRDRRDRARQAAEADGAAAPREIPIYLAALGPRTSRSRPRSPTAGCRSSSRPSGARGLPGAVRARGLRHRAGGPGCRARDDVEAARDAIADYALYVGGMGARGKNFYNELAGGTATRRRRSEIQDLYLDGKQRDAAAAVPGRARGRADAGRPARADRRPARGLEGVGCDEHPGLDAGPSTACERSRS